MTEKVQYRWMVSFHRDGDTLGLYHTRDRAVLAQMLICNRWVEWVLFHVPGGYYLWNKVLLWTDKQDKKVFSIPATEEMLRVLAPDSEWLWNDDYVDPDEDQ